MPLFQSARLELALPPDAGRPSAQFSRIRWSVRYGPLEASASEVAYFHASYRDHPAPVPGQDLVLLDTRGSEGEEEWAGHLVGTSIIFSHRAVLSTLEGDPRFCSDDSLTPQGQG